MYVLTDNMTGDGIYNGWVISAAPGEKGSRGTAGVTGPTGVAGATGASGSFTFGNLTTSITSSPGTTVRFTSNTTANSSGNLQINVLNNEISFALPTSMKLIETVISTANVVAGTANVGNISSNIRPDWATGSIFNYTLKTNANLFVPNNMPIGSSVTLVFTQDAVGSRIITPVGNVTTGTYLFAGNIRTLSTAANAVDMMNVVRTTSSQYLAAVSLGYK